jgi:hypothetical protein
MAKTVRESVSIILRVMWFCLVGKGKAKNWCSEKAGEVLV